MFEFCGMAMAIDTLWNTELNITIPTHLANSVTLCLQNLDLLLILVIVTAVMILLLELNSLAICLYLPAILHLFFDVNLDLLSHQQFASTFHSPTDSYGIPRILGI